MMRLRPGGEICWINSASPASCRLLTHIHHQLRDMMRGAVPGAPVKEYRIRCCSRVLHLKRLSGASAGKSLICPPNHANLHYSSRPAAALVTHLCVFSSYLIAHAALHHLKCTICVCRYSIWGISVSWPRISAAGWNVVKDGDDTH